MEKEDGLTHGEFLFIERTIDSHYLILFLLQRGKRAADVFQSSFGASSTQQLFHLMRCVAGIQHK